MLRLVGATAGQIRRPFLYLGLWYGLGGGLLGALVLSFGMGAITRPLQTLSVSYGVDIQVAGFDPGLIGGLVASGALLGVLGAAISARRSTARVRLA